MAEDEIMIATREAHIEALGKTIQVLNEKMYRAQTDAQQKDDLIKQLQVRANESWKDAVEPRDLRIAELNVENNALRKIAEEHLVTARAHRDRYDALCNEIGALGVDIPKLRAGKLTITENA